MIKITRRKKKKYVKVITKNDQKMLKALSRVGYMEKEDMKTLGLSERRIKNFERDCHIEKVHSVTREGTAYSSYRLTAKGKRLVTKHMDINAFYKSSSMRHDLGLAKVYMSLDDKSRDNWITEGEFREMMYLKLDTYDDHQRLKLQVDISEGNISPPDGGYYSNEGIVIIEVVTDSYGHSEIASKELFSSYLGAAYTEYKI